MDEIEYKLKSKNVILISEAIDMLIELTIIPSKDAGKSLDLNVPLRLLQESCSSADVAVSSTACKGFLHLVLDGFLGLSSATTTVMTMLPYVRQYCGITSIISGIIQLSVEQKLSTHPKYVCQWGLTSPLHPFVIILQQHPNAMPDILSEMHAICLRKPRMSLHSIEILRPVFLWILCNPNQSDSTNAVSAMNLLLLAEKCPGQTSLVLECLGWQQTCRQQPNAPNSKSHTSYEMYSIVTKWSIAKGKEDLIFVLIPALGNTICDLILAEEDPRPCIELIHQALDYPGSQVVTDCLLFLLAEAFISCPVCYLGDLMGLCKKTYRFYDNPLSIYILSSSLLQWLYYPTTLTRDFENDAKSIVDFAMHVRRKPCNSITTLCSNKAFYFMQSIHPRLYRVVEIFMNHEAFLGKPELFNVWIDRLKDHRRISVNTQNILSLHGLLMQIPPQSTKEVYFNKSKVFSVLIDEVKTNKSLAMGLLPVTLGALRMSRNAQEIVDFLRGISNMAVSKENVPAVVRVLEDLQKLPTFPISFFIELYLILFDNQTRCYPYLQQLLVGKKSKTQESEWEVHTARAKAVKHICETRAIIYGAELVPVISGILSCCNDTASSVAFCLALEGLKALWQSQIVAPAGTWKVLAPRITRDKRPSAQIGICDLLSSVPALYTPSPDNDKFLDESLTVLWQFVVNSHEPTVTVAALQALSRFKVEHMQLKHLPDIFRKGLKLPAEFCQTPSDAQRKPEDVLDYIPSECWANMFKYSNHSTLPGVSDFCHTLIEREILEYHSGVYHENEGKAEPENVKYLPVTSVVRGIMEFIRKQAVMPTYDCSDSIMLECLCCLAMRRPRPLPPLDWNFLHELFHRGPYYRQPCLALAASQAVISVSALRFIQSYLTSFSPEKQTDEEICQLLEILPTLCKNVDCGTLSPIIEDVVFHVFKISPKDAPTTLTDTKELFVMVLDSIKKCLNSQDIQEATRKALCDKIEEYFSVLDYEHRFWPHYLEVCCDLPMDYLERISSPSGWWETTAEMLRKACCIRSKLASDPILDNPLAWFNEIIDAAVSLPSEYPFVIRHMVPVLKSAKYDSVKTKDWLLQLMGRAQSLMVESTSTRESHKFVCDIVINSILTLTGCDNHVWRKDDALEVSVFPQAVAMLIGSSSPQYWQDTARQIVEWMHHTQRNLMLPQEYVESFYMCIVVIRDCPYFKNQNVWTKIITTKPYVIFT